MAFFIRLFLLNFAFRGVEFCGMGFIFFDRDSFTLLGRFWVGFRRRAFCIGLNWDLRVFCVT